MVRSEIITKLSKKIHHKLRKKDLEKIFEIAFHTIIQGIKNNRSKRFWEILNKRIKR